jgi:hypothetical protein
MNVVGPAGRGPRGVRGLSARAKRALRLGAWIDERFARRLSTTHAVIDAIRRAVRNLRSRRARDENGETERAHQWLR